MINFSLCKKIALTILMSLLFNSLPCCVVNAINEESNYFVENFDNITLTSGSAVIPTGWKFSGVYGSTTSAKIVERNDDTSKGNFIKLYHYTSNLNFGGATHLSSVQLDYKPIKISYEVYLHSAENTATQRIRAGILENRDTSNVTSSLMIQFMRNENGGWDVSEIGSLKSNRGMSSALLNTDGTNFCISKDAAQNWQKVDMICYPDGNNAIRNVRYFINDTEVISANANRSYCAPINGLLGDFAYYSQTANDSNSWFGLDNISVCEYQGEKGEAYIKFGNTLIKENIESPKYKDGTICTPGEGYWKISNNYSSMLYFPLNYSVGNSTDGSVYDLKITYIDKGKGYFAVWYDSIKFGKQLLKVIYLTGDNLEKSVNMQLSDAAFSMGVDGKGDVAISLSETGIVTGNVTTYSSNPLYIKELSINKEDKNNIISVESETNMRGNTFSYYDDSKIINNEIKNLSNLFISTKVTYRLVDSDNNVVFTESHNRNLNPKEVIEDSVNIGTIKKCDIYKLYVDTKTNGVEFTFPEDDICIVKTDPDGINSEFAWINYNIDEPEDTVQLTGVELIKKANIAGVRTVVLWSDVIDSTGKFADDFWQTSPGKKIKLLKDNGIPYWVMLLGKNYSIPTGSDELSGWKDFCSYVMRNTYKDAKVYEIWNEPDLSSFNTNGATPADIANVTKVAKQAAREVEFEVSTTEKQYVLPISGLSVTGLWNENRRNYWLKEAMDAGIITDQYGMDMLNVHTYAENESPESAKIYEILKQYQSDIKEKCGISNFPILISEYGYPSSDSNVKDNKADWIIRSALLYKANGVGEMSALYNLERRGILETNREDCFGIISYLNNKYNVEGKTGIPNDSYLKYAGMNYILGGNISNSCVVRDNNVKILKFSSDKFGTDVYAMWTLSGNDDVTVDLGSEQAILYDAYGNETVLNKADGKYNVTLNQSVKYIRSENSQKVVDENDDKITIIEEDTNKIGVEFAVSKQTVGSDLYIAFFDNDSKLINVTKQSVNKPIGEKFQSEKVEIPEDSFFVKTFVWSSDGCNKPLLPMTETKKKYKSVIVSSKEFNSMDSELSGDCTCELYEGDYRLKINGNSVKSIFVTPDIDITDEGIEYVEISVDCKMIWDFQTDLGKRIDFGIALNDDSSSRMMLSRFTNDGSIECSISSTPDAGMQTTQVGIIDDAKKLYNQNGWNTLIIRYYPKHPENSLKGAYELLIKNKETGKNVKLFEGIRAASAPENGKLGKIYFGAVRSGTTYFDNLIIKKKLAK